MVTVIGAGLAGCEAAWQVAQRGHFVDLYEMRPDKMTPAHKTADFAEMVCSNSFGSNVVTNASGLLKAELRKMGSLLIAAAEQTAVPAGLALAVDRNLFSNYVDRKIRNHPRISVHFMEVSEIDLPTHGNPLIIASGPLTSRKLAEALSSLVGTQNLAFYDAISPIVSDDSIDHSQVFRQARYDKGDGADYINIPLTQKQYYEFVDQLLGATLHQGHEEVDGSVIDGIKPFEGCMPIEDQALRGRDTLLYGPFKPVGLIDPKTKSRPFAVIQLRQDNRQGTMWSMVAVQTRLKHSEQLRLFRSLPGLHKANFIRLGSVHRNTFINSPAFLNSSLESRNLPGLFCAGQLIGTEGYVESIAGGLIAGINACRICQGLEPLVLSRETMCGALLSHITDPDRKGFQPMNANFGLIPDYNCFQLNNRKGIRFSKIEKRQAIAERSLSHYSGRETNLTLTCPSAELLSSAK